MENLEDTIRRNILTSLLELSDKTFQEMVWLGHVPGMQGCLAEALCQLYDDTGLGTDLDSNRVVFSQKIDDWLRDLRSEIILIDRECQLGTHDMIKSPAMDRVRERARRILLMIAGIEK